MTKCKSIGQCEMIKVTAPKFLGEVKEIYIDKCIQEVVKHLWKHKIKTLGCCCGHGEETASIVLDSCYSKEDLLYIKNLLSDVTDPGKIKLAIWELNFY